MAVRQNCLSEKAEIIFNKRYKLKSVNDKYTPPEANTVFETPHFTIAPLLKIKNSLNATKNLLNSKDIEKWRCHTSRTNPCGSVVKYLRQQVRPELCTQAWAKFYEIISSCNIIPKKCIDNKILTSLHLCEAPGAFVASLNHHIKSEYDDIHWTWLASTLNPFYEGNDNKRMISGECFIIETLSCWNFGASWDGDLMVWENVECLIDALGGRGKADIVTADGSISCADEPDKQEIVIGQLLYCEVFAALVNLTLGGSLLVKMFTMFESLTVNVLFLLSCLFEEVEIIKPGTSKPGNSEVYCVCTNFSGLEHLSKDLLEKLQIHYTSFAAEQALFPRDSLPETFLEKVITCAEIFSSFQTNAINRNIELFENSTKGKWKFLNRLRNYLCKEFVDRFNVKTVEQGLFVVPHVYMDGTQHSYWPESMMETYCKSGTHHTGSYIERVAMSKLSWHQRVVSSQDVQISSMLTQDILVNEILDTDEKIDWLQCVNSPDVLKNWSIELGKPIQVIQSSRFCPATLINQLNEARRNANVCYSEEGKHLLQTLQYRTQQRMATVGLNPNSIATVLHKCGLWRGESKNSSILDISGNARFVSQLIESGNCYAEQCLALLCENCVVSCNAAKLQGVVHHSCLSDDKSAVQKLRRFSCEKLKENERKEGNNRELRMERGNPRPAETIVRSDGAMFKHRVQSDEAKTCIIVGTVYKQCQQINDRSYDELSCRIPLLYECLTALRLLQPGDSLVLEISNTLTQFTVGLTYVLYLLFEEIALISQGFCPSSKQLLVCRDYVNREQATSVLAHLENVCNVMASKPPERDVISLLPIKELFTENFYKYIRKQATNHVASQLKWIVNCERLLWSTNEK